MLFVTWDEMGPGRRAWQAVGAALVWGLLCGLALGASAALYIAGGIIASLGAIVGGMQHADLRGALLRGTAGGLTFGLAVLAGWQLSGGGEAAVALPHPAIGLLVFTVVPGLALNALGWRLGRTRGAGRPEPADTA